MLVSSLRYIERKMIISESTAYESDATLHSLRTVNWVLRHVLNAVLLEKITFLSKYLKLQTSIHQQLTWVSLKEKQSVPTLQFTVRSECVVVSLSKCCTFREKHYSWKCLKVLQAFTNNSHALLWKRSTLFQHFNSMCEVNGVLLHFLNAVLSVKITFLRNCLKILTNIHQQLTCISLKEEQSVPTLQFNLRSE